MSNARRLLSRFIDAIETGDREELEDIADFIVGIDEEEAEWRCTYGADWTGEGLELLRFVAGGDA